MNNESLISKLLKSLVMVTIHVACSIKTNGESEIGEDVEPKMI